MMAWVAILMGSESDWPVMQSAADTLRDLDVRCEVRITSAHRTPKATTDYVKDAESRGCQVFICGAGMAAHLAGAVAAQTIRPVVGVPLDAGALAGVDALLATVQMPGGIPVATVAIGKAGAKNSAYLAAQMLALNDPALATRLRADRAASASRIAEQNARLAEQRGDTR
jgi:5-(carboxyamino)imidazole ribonucleotide mutase